MQLTAIIRVCAYMNKHVHTYYVFGAFVILARRAAYVGSWLPMFRDNTSVPSSWVKEHKVGNQMPIYAAQYST